MEEWQLTLLMGILSSSFGIFAIYLQNKRDKESKLRDIKESKKVEAEATATIGKAYQELFDELDEKIKKLTGQISVLEGQILERDTRIADLETEVDDLRKLMKERGIEPPPRKRTKK